jgi:hypothetical protein
VAIELYQGRRLKSTASYELASGTWVPSISITWVEADTSHVHTFDGPAKYFITAAEAVSYGFLLARLWVDKKF